MATGLEFLGALAAIFGIIGQFDSLVKDTRRCVRSLKYAKDDVQGLEDDMDNFNIVLEQFHDSVKVAYESAAGVPVKLMQPKLLKQINRSSSSYIAQMTSILENVEPLRADKGYSRAARWMAYLMWHLRKEDMKPLRASLDSTKLGLNLIMTMLIFHHLEYKTSKLERGKDAEAEKMREELSRCRERVRALSKRCRKAEEKCAQLQLYSATSREHPPPAQITEYIRKVAREVMAEEKEQSTARGSDVSSQPPSLEATPSLPTSSGRPVAGLNDPVIHLARDIGLSNPSPRESIIPEAQPPTPPGPLTIPQAHQWMPTALFGPPQHQPRPLNPRASTPELPEGPVIHDDGQCIRKEYRRPRKAPNGYGSGSGSSVSVRSSRQNPGSDSNLGNA